MTLLIIYKTILFAALPAALLMISLAVLSLKKKKRILPFLLGLFSIPLLFLGGLLNYDIHLSRNQSRVDEAIVLESWDGISDGTHNSNTDLIKYDDSLLLIHQASPFHLGSDKAVLKVQQSHDGGKSWTKISEIDGGMIDIRDPKFILEKGEIQLYVLMNNAMNPEPYTTLRTSSRDGRNWKELKETGFPEWLFWRAKKGPDGYWYAPAYYYEHGSSILLRSPDGKEWERIAEIYSGGRNDETAIEFLPDGRLLATGRLEYSDSVLGHEKGSTVIALAGPPYREFEVSRESPLTRLDGPRLFTYRDRILAVARYQPDTVGFGNKPGSAFTRKRTSLFEVREEGLIWLSDLPSAGDTSYAGVVVEGNRAIVSYYSSRIDRDYMWVTGLFYPSAIRMAVLDLDAALNKDTDDPR